MHSKWPWLLFFFAEMLQKQFEFLYFLSMFHCAIAILLAPSSPRPPHMHTPDVYTFRRVCKSILKVVFPDISTAQLVALQSRNKRDYNFKFTTTTYFAKVPKKGNLLFEIHSMQLGQNSRKYLLFIWRPATYVKSFLINFVILQSCRSKLVINSMQGRQWLPKTRRGNCPPAPHPSLTPLL